MGKEIARNIKVGIVVVLGTILIIYGLYVIGNKQHIFGSTFRISTQFYDVNGLMAGNNVRLAGIDVGTVESVEITSDSTVNVVMMIENRVKKFIKKNAIAGIGTDGLMGNKLVNINSSGIKADYIQEGDVLKSIQPFESDEMLRTLNTTNENMKYVTTDLKMITQKINSSKTLWSLLMDTVWAENVKSTIVNIKLTSHRSAVITGDLSSIVKNVQAGKGSIGSLITDSGVSEKLDHTMIEIQQITNKMAVITGDLSSVTGKLKNGDGVIGTLLMDTALVNNLNTSMKNIKDGTQGFNENMEAMKHSIFFRKYFKKKKVKT